MCVNSDIEFASVYMVFYCILEIVVMVVFNHLLSKSSRIVAYIAL